MLASRGPWQAFCLLCEGGNLGVCRLLPLQFTAAIIPQILLFRPPLGCSGFHFTTRFQYSAAELVQLLVQQSCRISHHYEPTQIELILKNVE